MKRDSQKNSIIIYEGDDGQSHVEVRFEGEMAWLSQAQLVDLYQSSKANVSEHIKNIFFDRELEENVVVRKIRTTTKHGAIEGKTQSKSVKYYNLKTITAVGYRVNSHRAIEFRKWATEILHEYIIKGFAMDDERLKQIKHFGQDYFDEALERIREIRLSKRRFYQKITDIYATAIIEVKI